MSDPILKKIYQAQEGKKVTDCSDEELRALLAYIITLLGLPERNDPIQETGKDGEKVKIGTGIILQYMRSYWPTKPVEDIRLAFEMAVAKEFEVDVRLFDQPLNVEFLSRVLTAYWTFKRKKTDPKGLPMKEEPKAIETKPMTGEQSYNELLKTTEETKKIPLIWAWEKVFAYMEEAKIITDSNEEKKLFADNVRATIEQEATEKKLKKGSEFFSVAEYIKKENATAAFKYRCRKERVIAFLKAKFGL